MLKVILIGGVVVLAALSIGHFEGRYTAPLGAVAVVRNAQECRAIDTDTGQLLGTYPMKEGRCGGKALRDWRRDIF